MALIKCPKCGKEVSDRAKQCPNCGCPEPANQPTVAKEEEKELIAKGKAIRCPNCDGILTNISKPCPNCGCSDTLKFQKIAKKEYLHVSPDGTLGYFTGGHSATTSNSPKREQSPVTSNSPSPTVNEIRYEVKPDAERVANAVANFILWSHIILGIGSIVVGIVLGIEDDEVLFFLIPIGVFNILIGIIVWASIKLFVNISRNLYNINDSIQRLHSLVMQKE